MKEPEIFLQHIIENISLIESFSKNLTKEKLASNELIQYALVRAIEIIGEAAKNLSKDFTARHTDIPWKAIIGTRDKIIHQYFDIDLEAIWDTVQNDIPDLKKKINEILKKI